MQNNDKKVFEIIFSKTRIYLIIIAILLIVICVENTKLIIPSILLFVGIVTYAYFTNSKRKTEISKHLHELTTNVDKITKNVITNSPFPLIIVETNGDIIWKSSKFVNEFKNVDINNILTELLKNIKLEIENNIDKKYKRINTQIEIANKQYKIIGEYEKSKQKEKKKTNEYMLNLYFIDETEHLKVMQECKNIQTCVGILKIDNYEELIQKIPNENKTKVLAEIEKIMYDWAMSTKGLLIKDDRETYIYVFEQQYLESLKETKFDLLDIVKDIDIDERMQITLSIAVSTEGTSNYEKYKTALIAMDVALGRGGDQAVIREDGKYSFFGGRTAEVEKRTKVKARTIADAISELIKEAENVIIMGHINPDIDAIGSSLGIFRLAKTLQKEAYIVNNNIAESLENYSTEIEKTEEYKDVFIDGSQAIDKITPNTLLVVVDTHKSSFVEVPALLDETDNIVIIDHHRRGEDFIDKAILTFHEVYASSAAELVTELIQYVEPPLELTTLERESLYAGIMMDTKNFTFKTGVRTFEAAAYLRKCGVDIIRVKKWFQSDLKSYNVISEIVRKAEIVRETIGISIAEEENKVANVICAKAADELLTISNITASFVIGNMGKKVCISGRSIGEINVQLVLEKLGGGGHITLAGAQLEGVTCEQAKGLLIEKIDEYFQEIGN